MKTKPEGWNFRMPRVFLTTAALTAQEELVASGSFSLETPFGTENVSYEVPHDNVTSAGDVMSAAAHK